MLLHVVAIFLAGDALDDETEDDVAGVGVMLRGAGLELQGLIGEQRQEVFQLE